MATKLHARTSRRDFTATATLSQEPQYYSYARFSSGGRQAFGSSIQRQIEKAQEWCAKNGVQLSHTTFQDKGISGAFGDHTDKGNLGAFLSLCEDGTIRKGDYLIVESLSRFSRQDVDDVIQLMFRINDYGVTIITLEPEQEYNKETRRTNPFIYYPFIAQCMANNQYVEKLSADVARGRKFSRDKKRLNNTPLSKHCPSWLVYKDDPPRFEKDPTACKTVELIIDMCQQGIGDFAIAAFLNKEKVPTIAVRRRRTNNDDATSPIILEKATQWTRSYVQEILSNPALFGRYIPKLYSKKHKKRTPLPEHYDNYFPALIDESTFTILQAQRLGRWKRGSSKCETVPNLFSGLLRNAKNNGYFQRRNVDYPRLCSTEYLDGKRYPYPDSFPFDILQASLIKGIEDKLRVKDLFSARPHAKRLTALHADRELNEHKIEQIKKRITAIDNDEILRDTTLLDILDELERNRKLIDDAIAKEQESISAVQDVDAGIIPVPLTVSLLAVKGEERTQRVAKLKAKIRSLIAEVYIWVEGQQRARRKTAIATVYFKNGVQQTLIVSTYLNQINRIHIGEYGQALPDMRTISNDPTERASAEIVFEHAHAAFSALRD